MEVEESWEESISSQKNKISNDARVQDATMCNKASEIGLNIQDEEINIES